MSLRFEHGMGITEIARLRDKHHSSVQEVLQRAQAKLKSNPDERLVSDKIRREREDGILDGIDQERRQNEAPSRRLRSDDMS